MRAVQHRADAFSVESSASMSRRLPLVVLVGRPNVGKSTLFNRIAGSRRAIVTAIAGTTRDVIQQQVQVPGAEFVLVDTGGMFGASEDPLHELVFAKGQQAIAQATLLVVVLDGQQGLVPGDADIAKALRASGKPIIGVVNKLDVKRAREASVQFYELGIDPMFEISAEHGVGVGDLLDEVVARLRQGARGRTARAAPGAEGLETAENDEPRDVRPEETAVAIVGRPNAGKSSLVNRLLREERMLVSEMPGTTRDAIDAVLRWHRREFRIVDTAGIRRPGRVARSGQVESLSVLVARRAIEKADVVVLVVDATAGATDQDAAIAGEADRLGRGVIIAMNKWDLIERGTDVRAFDEAIRRQLKFLDYAPLLHISAATGERTPKLLEAIDRVAEARRKRVPTPEFNRFVQAVTAVHPPASPGRRQVRILYAAQTGVAPPTFVFFTNVATAFHFSYERFLVNQIRDAFGFPGSPIRLQVRRRDRAKDGGKRR